LYRVVVSDRHENEFLILGQADATRPLADFDRLHDSEFVGIYHADSVALLVRDIGGEGARLAADHDEDAHAKQTTARPGEAGTSPAQKTLDAALRRHRFI
jgi:hypothetical protein